MQERVKSSLGTHYYNKGGNIELSQEKYQVDYSRAFYLFDVVPMGAVRMTQSDKWKTNPNHVDPKKRQRKAVQQYFELKTVMTRQANIMKFEVGEFIDAVFMIPMPDSWSKKKKEAMNGLPCKQKPDTDNLLKLIGDFLKQDDAHIWYMKGQKYWAYKGSILIYK